MQLVSLKRVTHGMAEAAYRSQGAIGPENPPPRSQFERQSTRCEYEVSWISWLISGGAVLEGAVLKSMITGP